MLSPIQCDEWNESILFYILAKTGKTLYNL